MVPTTKLRLILSCLMLVELMRVGCAPTVAPTATTKAVPAPAGQATQISQPTVTPAAAPAAPVLTPKPGAEQPRSGGIMTRPLYEDPPSFDLQQEQLQPASITLFNVYQGLVRLDPIQHEKVMPELAEKWEIGADGKTYYFKFRSGIKWHDGQPFTMDDVKYSLDRMQNPKAFKAISPRGEALLTAMESSEIAGGDTIKITTKYPSSSFLTNIATGWIAIMPKHILMAKGDMKRDVAGTGPFKFKGYVPQVTLELARNPDYYVRGLPYLDGIRFYTIRDDASRFAAFRTGQVLMTFLGSRGLSQAQAEIVGREMAGVADVYDHSALSRYVIAMNLERSPWENVKVRKAVDLAVDRQAAIKVNGRGIIGTVFDPGGPWGLKQADMARLPGYQQPKAADIAEAKRLLAEAGFPEGFKTKLLFRGGGATEQQAIVAKDQLAKIGIDAELQLAETASVTARLNRRDFDVLSYIFSDTIGDPDETFNTLYVTGGSRNFTSFSNKEIDELILKQAGTLDEKARRDIVAEIERRLIELVPMSIVFWDIYQMGAWKKVKGFKPGSGFAPWGKLDHVWLTD